MLKTVKHTDGQTYLLTVESRLTDTPDGVMNDYPDGHRETATVYVPGDYSDDD